MYKITLEVLNVIVHGVWSLGYKSHSWELLLLGATIAIPNPSSIPEVSTDDHMHQIPSERIFKLEAICVRTAKSYIQLSI